jgi:mono/diheme cytochrome c family protein
VTTILSDDGKPAAMPEFGSMFSDAQIDQIVSYNRELKPG